ncbi:MAG: MATE family efflux transporter [Clostridiales Family XIII bacterium]|jgi:putative MATE family efflux protein|nr:MATE family efflux transporter [Clostridiales Family XIII bacterium]
MGNDGFDNNNNGVEKENKMGVMPVGKLLASMSFPAMVSMLIQALYNVVDSFFVARISENALSAVTLIFPIQILMISVSVGTGVGLSSLIARRLGEKRFKEADHAAAHGFLLALCSWIIFALFGIFGTTSFVNLFSDDPEISELAIRFCSIVSIGSLFLFFQINAEKTLQATGNMLFPMIFNITGAVCNIILNPILIFGLFGAPKLGIAGSAISTVIAQFIGMSLGLFMLLRFKHAVHISFRGFRPRAKTIMDIYAVGLPSIIMQAVMSFTMSIMNFILIRLTPTAVAVLGVYFRIQSLIFMPVFGLNQGALPIIGYNFGARNKARVVETYRKAVFVALAVMAIGTLLFQLFPEEILRVFNATPDMFRIGVRALHIISIGFVFAAFAIVSITVFQALAHGVLTMVLSMMRQIIFTLPLAWFLAEFFGVDYFWFCYPISEILATAILSYFVVRVYRREIRDLGDERL